MKTRNKTLLILMVVLLIVPLNLMAQKKEIPITTSSKEALKLFLDGRDKSENFEIAAAALLFDQAIQKDTNFAMAYLYRSFSGGGYHVWQKNHDKAIALMDKVSDGEKLLIQYFQASSKGEGVKIKEYLDQLLMQYQSDKRVQMVAGQYYYGMNDFTNALIHYKKATEIDKKYAPAFNMVGYSYSAINNYVEAEKAFKTYIRIIPNKAASYDSYAELLMKMGKYDESIIQYKKALDLDPDFAASMIGIGNNYIFKGNYDAARKFYQLRFDKSPNINGKFGALYWIAVSYVHEGNVDMALKTYAEYRALAEQENLIPNIFTSYIMPAWILIESENPEEGIVFIRKAADLVANAELPEAAKENLTLSSMACNVLGLTAIGEMESAKAEYEKCQQMIEARKNPGEIMEFKGLLGYYEYMNGDYDKAIATFAEANKEDPYNWYYTAQAYSKKGENQAAANLYEKIANLNINGMELALVKKKAMLDLSNR